MDIKDKKCLVVGGGSVGLRKAATLQKCGWHVPAAHLNLKSFLNFAPDDTAPTESSRI